MVNGIDPATLQWREMFATQMAGEFQHQRAVLDEIRELLQKQNDRVRTNEAALGTKADTRDCQANSLAIASLKTWVAVVGGMVGLIGIATALLQAMK